jgi:hypothetical protein
MPDILKSLHAHLTDLGYGAYLMKYAATTDPMHLRPDQIHLDLDCDTLIVYLTHSLRVQATFDLDSDFNFEIVHIDLNDPQALPTLENLLHDFTQHEGNYERKPK